VVSDCSLCGGAEGHQPCLFCREGIDRVTNNQLVGEFHRAFGVAEPGEPTFPDDEIVTLRWHLMREEHEEVEDAIIDWDEGRQDLAHIAKELADLLVVTYGTARAFGIDIDAVFAEVHRSNMSKLGDDGLPIRRSDGKVLKGPNYSPADIESVLDRQAR
jgi:predicted HAD superfamily Cof-like phosphohydrolase